VENKGNRILVEGFQEFQEFQEFQGEPELTTHHPGQIHSRRVTSIAVDSETNRDTAFVGIAPCRHMGTEAYTQRLVDIGSVAVPERLPVSPVGY
jgi:hypothetical protein